MLKFVLLYFVSYWSLIYLGDMKMISSIVDTTMHYVSILP